MAQGNKNPYFVSSSTSRKMKKLILVRHAKSSWSFDCRDHDRPLGKRGRKDVLKMGKYAKKRISCPELIITSSASRALYTALHLADHWGYPEEKIITSNKLYHSTPLEIGEILSELGQIDSVALLSMSKSSPMMPPVGMFSIIVSLTLF